jgi:hypothetical protein
MLRHRRRKEGDNSEASHTDQPQPPWRKIFSGLGSSSKSNRGKKLSFNNASEAPEDEGALDSQVTPCEDAPTAQRHETTPTLREVISKVRPIAELWDEAYQDLALQNKTLIEKYELQLALGADFHTLDLTQKRVKMKTLLEEKIKSIEDESWKLRFNEHEFAIKDAVGRVAGVIEVRLG